jgi:RNA polymerase sigma factor (sigma-70 family)
METDNDSIQYRAVLRANFDQLTTPADQEAKFDHGVLREAMKSLPKRSRQALDLVYFQGMSMREAGVKMGIRRQRVHQIIVEARGLLRKNLEKA